MGMTRGAYAKVIKQFILDKYGQPGLDEVVGRLEHGLQRTLTHPITLVWVDNKDFNAIFDAICSLFGERPDELAHRLGRYHAEQTIGWFYRFLVSLSSPEAVIQKFPTMWKSFNTSGEVTLELGKNQARARLTGYEDPGNLCLISCGFVEKALEMTGTKNARVTHPECAARGQATCIFEARWD